MASSMIFPSLSPSPVCNYSKDLADRKDARALCIREREREETAREKERDYIRVLRVIGVYIYIYMLFAF